MTLPPRLEPLLKQFDDARNRLITRLQGVTDDEYLWEPVPNCWSIRRRDACQTGMSFGKGAWVMEFEGQEPVPPPVTTIAWRMCHLANDFLHRADYTTGTRSLAVDDYEVFGGALDALSSLDVAAETWRTVLINTTDEQLDQVGRSQLPWGLDPRLPFLDIIWWVNQELLSHGAEIALLRDLYRTRLR
ncbi:DinB family protein [Dictyobacter formicarum]|uniref:DinB-like domain-containing protein n=1 Tax=Dictyobacter formicarum TaxID=2778368 RepID=A0ABQ3VMC7_9CHLR|nr:DinB family protein [Dictyobacter formicarum]GHO87362.1 hypothetical protein KSZ_53680 [Dictyobacter formicarum]